MRNDIDQKLSKPWMLFWLALHLFLLVGLFTYRFDLTNSSSARRAWSDGQFEKKFGDVFQNYAKLYFSGMVEVYFWEFSQTALGRTLPEQHPWTEHGAKQLNASQQPLKNQNSNSPKPYVDIPWEYPPLLMAPVLVAGAVSNNFLDFIRALAWQSALAYLLCLYLAYRLWQALPKNLNRPFNLILASSALGVFLLGQVFVNRLDVFASLFYLAALLAFQRAHIGRSAIWIGLGFLTKAYPLILAPLFLGILILRKQYAAALKFVSIGLSTLAIFAMGFHYFTLGKGWESFVYHSARGLQIESLFALIPYWGHLLFKWPIVLNDDYGAWHIASLDFPWLSTFSTIFFFFLFGAFYATSFSRYKKMKFKSSSEKINNAFILQNGVGLLLVWLVSFKVLSPQFFVWLMPLIFLLPKISIQSERNLGSSLPSSSNSSSEKIFWIIYFLTLALSQVLWPNIYSSLENAEPLGIFILTARNVGLIILLMMVWRGRGVFKKTLLQ